MGLFPGCVAAGGIQASGRIAWDAISTSIPTGGQRLLFCYGDHRSGGAAKRANGIHTATRQGAILSALRTRTFFQLAVVWHMDLLKLLPFFRSRAATVVLMLQGIEAWRRRSWPERRLLKQVDLFLSISDYTWSRFLVAYPEYAGAQHCTVPLGIGTPWDGSTPLPGHVPAALMLGRLERREDYKGHRQMIEAWPRVRQLLATAELWIVGEGDLRPDLERLAMKHGVGNAVRFFGFVSEQQKHDLLCQSYCMALPSRGEGFGLVYLEALRLGRPCLVSTDDAGIEVVAPPQTGLAVDPDDCEAVANAACRLLTFGPQWDAWSIRARQRYEQRFTAQQYEQRLLSALDVARRVAA